jgi:hypothetical protein
MRTVEKIAKEKIVEKLLEKHSDFKNNPYIDDLAQDIYIQLTLMSEESLNQLYTNGELEFFIKRIIKNNLYSTTSQFYYKYQKFRKITDEINYKNEEDED